MEEGSAQLGALIGAFGAPLVLLARTRLTLFAGFALLAAAEAVLFLALVPPGDLRSALGRTTGFVAIALASTLALGLAAVFVRRPELAPLALLLAAPFRLPVDLAGERSYLLTPLYGVLAAAVAALLYRSLRVADVRALPLFVAVPTSVLAALFAVSLLWSRDVRAGSIVLTFFVLPFVALTAVVARTTLAPWLPRALAATVVGLAVVFVAIGFWQLENRELFGTRSLEVANAYTSYFRVTSTFKDPSIFGRFLVIATAILLVLMFLKRLTWVVGVPLVVVLWAGLFVTYSQSSQVALFAVVALIAVLLGDRMLRLTVVGATVVFALAAGAVSAHEASETSLRDVSRGRSRLVEETVAVIRAHPLAGVGIGAQPRASADEAGRRTTRGSASHTTPLTVAAELGALGVLVYGLFVAGLAWLAWAVTKGDRALGLAIAAACFVVFVHSLFYSGFFEDPIIWGALGLGSAALARARPASTAT